MTPKTLAELLKNREYGCEINDGEAANAALNGLGKVLPKGHLRDVVLVVGAALVGAAVGDLLGRAVRPLVEKYSDSETADRTQDTLMFVCSSIVGLYMHHSILEEAQSNLLRVGRYVEPNRWETSNWTQRLRGSYSRW